MDKISRLNKYGQAEVHELKKINATLKSHNETLKDSYSTMTIHYEGALKLNNSLNEEKKN